MEALIRKIEGILDQFAREEMSNKLSQFSMLSLKTMILSEIAGFKIDDKGVKLTEKCKPHINEV